MPPKPNMTLEEFVTAAIAIGKRIRLLNRLKITLISLCWMALLAGISIKIMDGQSKAIISLGLLAGLFGIAVMIPDRITKLINSKTGDLREAFQYFSSILDQENKEPLHSKIPLTIGFANLSGEDLSHLVTEDAAALSPLFTRSNIVADHQIPGSEILFVYAHLNEDGTIRGIDSSGIRQIVQLTNSAIVILASPNTPSSIQRAVTLPGPNTSNIVFTVDRNGEKFSQFFRELFRKMHDGKDMLSAWVEITPQNPNANTHYTPQTLLLAEAGKISFPR